MFSRHLIAAAALMAATCAANADVITTTSTDSTLASDMSIVDTSTALSGADSGLAAILASSGKSAQMVLVRGVEGTYMLARTNAPLASNDETATPTVPAAAADESSDIATAPIALPATSLINPPSVNASVVPEPASLALMFAGLLGLIGFTRARKQG